MIRPWTAVLACVLSLISGSLCAIAFGGDFGGMIRSAAGRMSSSAPVQRHAPSSGFQPLVPANSQKILPQPHSHNAAGGVLKVIAGQAAPQRSAPNNGVKSVVGQVLSKQLPAAQGNWGLKQSGSTTNVATANPFRKLAPSSQFVDKSQVGEWMKQHAPPPTPTNTPVDPHPHHQHDFTWLTPLVVRVADHHHCSSQPAPPVVVVSPTPVPVYVPSPVEAPTASTSTPEPMTSPTAPVVATNEPLPSQPMTSEPTPPTTPPVADTADTKTTPVAESSSQPPVEKPLELPVGVPLRLQIKGLGNDTGRVAVQFGEALLEADVQVWNDEGITLMIPPLGISKPTESKLHLVKFDGEVAQTLNVVLLGSPTTAVAVKD